MTLMKITYETQNMSLESESGRTWVQWVARLRRLMSSLPALPAVDRALAHHPLPVADAAAALLAAEGPHEQ